MGEGGRGGGKGGGARWPDREKERRRGGHREQARETERERGGILGADAFPSGARRRVLTCKV